MKVFVTEKYMKNAFDKITQLQKELENIRREKNISFEGDTNTWHDNFAYEQLTREEQQTAKLLADLSSEFSNMQIISFNPNMNDIKTVGLYCHVCVNQENLTSGTITEKQFDIVPLGNENITENIYAYNAPLIKPLMGLNPGEDVTVVLPTGETQITVLSVEASDINKIENAKKR